MKKSIAFISLSLIILILCNIALLMDYSYGSLFEHIDSVIEFFKTLKQIAVINAANLIRTTIVSVAVGAFITSVYFRPKTAIVGLLFLVVTLSSCTTLRLTPTKVVKQTTILDFTFAETLVANQSFIAIGYKSIKDMNKGKSIGNKAVRLNPDMKNSTYFANIPDWPIVVLRPFTGQNHEFILNACNLDTCLTFIEDFEGKIDLSGRYYAEYSILIDFTK